MVLFLLPANLCKGDQCSKNIKKNRNAAFYLIHTTINDTYAIHEYNEYAPPQLYGASIRNE